MVIGSGLERRDLDAGAHVVDVLPADLIGEAVLVVSGRIELIERAARRRRSDSSSPEAKLYSPVSCTAPRSGQRLAHLPVPRPRADRVGAERAALHRHLDAVVEPRRQLARRAHAGRRLLRDRRRCASLAAQVDVATPEQSTARRSPSAPAFGVVAYAPANRLPLPLLSNSSGKDAHDRGAEDVDLHSAFARKVTRAAVERPRGVHPVDVADAAAARRTPAPAGPVARPTGALASPTSANATRRSNGPP